ncbi:hypothetical protein CVS40_11883 [Lucilia cuprina]|nr:hypothetical protein CVS40_11883 [Lucilia cuprina]
MHLQTSEPLLHQLTGGVWSKFEINSDNCKCLVGVIYRPYKSIDLMPIITYFEENSLLHYVNTSTTIHFSLRNSTVLDVFLVNNPAKILLYDQIMSSNFSKHDLIYLIHDFPLCDDNSPKKYYALSSEIDTSNWYNIYNNSDVNKQIEYLNEVIPILVEKYIPVKTKIIISSLGRDFSKHDLIYLIHDFPLCDDNSPKSIYFRDYKNLEYYALSSEIDTSNWYNIYNNSDVNKQIEYLNEVILYLFEKYIPVKTKIIISSSRPWFNMNLCKLLEKRNLAYDEWKRYRTLQTYDTFKSIRKTVNRAIKNAKRDYFN